MGNTSTFLYLYSNLEMPESELIDVDSLFSEKQGTGEFDEVFELLEMTSVEPGFNVINNILEYSRMKV